MAQLVRLALYGGSNGVASSRLTVVPLSKTLCPLLSTGSTPDITEKLLSEA